MIKAFLGACCLIITSSVVSQQKILWQIGKMDNSAAEFALAPAGKDSFNQNFGGENTVYQIGYSDTKNHWPYVLPGPMDAWAGGGYWSGLHPRHFPRIFFNVKNRSLKGSCRLVIDFADVNAEHAPELRVEINGHRLGMKIQTGNGKGLNGDFSQGKKVTASFDFPANWITKGLNSIQLSSVSGSWAVFDNIRLEGKGKLKLANASSSLVLSVKAAPFELDNGRIQPLLLDIIQQDKADTLKIIVAGLPPFYKRVEKGHSILEIPMPAANRNGPKIIAGTTVIAGNNVIHTGRITRSPQPMQTITNYVDLLMGTGNSRWMFKPGPSLPLSMVQIAPDNQEETWKGGYEYMVESIMGFSHFSGWTMNGLLTMPTGGPLRVNPGNENNSDSGYRSRIDKTTETAEIGKYSVLLTDTDIKAEITSTRRAALQRYTFPAMDSARIMVDLFTPGEYPHNLREARITKVNDKEIEGYATYYNAFTGRPLEQSYTVYFVLQFSKSFRSMGGWVDNEVPPVKTYLPNWHRSHSFQSQPEIEYDIQEIAGKGDVGVFLNFKTRKGEVIQVRSGVSLVDLDGARNNLQTELIEPFGWNFEKVVQYARDVWNGYLSRIQIQTDDHLQKIKFYTNLYRSLAATTVWSDADGRYRDENEEIRQLANPKDDIVSNGYQHSFWNQQQLFNLIAPEISEKWARSAIELYKNSGSFNIGPGIERIDMTQGMHPVSQILSAWQAGIRNFSLDTAYAGFKKIQALTSENPPGGDSADIDNRENNIKQDYLPIKPGSVTNTMDLSYDDWCLSQMATILGKKEDAQFFLNRSRNWRNLFDNSASSVQPKDSLGNWIAAASDPDHSSTHDPMLTWFVPQAPDSLIALVGKDRFLSLLNEAMEKPAKTDAVALDTVKQDGDNFMQLPYLYNWAGAPWLTQKWVRTIQEHFYGTTPYDAYPDEEDPAAMSSWFIMSTIGLFQMDGGCALEPVYEIGSPRYPQVKLVFNGKYNRANEFVIKATNASRENKYIQSVKLNGKIVEDFRIPQSEVLKGGQLELIMGPEPNKNWGVSRVE